MVTDQTATPAQRQRAVGRLYRLAAESVSRTWGPAPEALLGPVLYRAVLGEECLRLAAGQQDDVQDSTVRFMIEGFWKLLADTHPRTQEDPPELTP